MIPRHSVTRFYRIRPEKIHYITFTIEAYEGLAVVSTIDKKAGIIKLVISPGQEDIVDAIVEHEGKELGITRIYPEQDQREGGS